MVAASSLTESVDPAHSELRGVAGAEPTNVTTDRAQTRLLRAPDWSRDRSAWAVLLVVLAWGVPFTRAGGGRDGFALTAMLILAGAGFVLVRAWRTVRLLDLLALLPAALAFVACIVSPTGFDGADDAAAFGLAGLLYLVVRGHLAAGRTVAPVVLALVVSGLDQFAMSWWAWWGSQQSSTLMVGTYYWHNQFAVHLAALGLLAGSVAVLGRGRLRLLATALAVLSVPALAFAASRATIALFLLGWLVLVVIARRDRRALARAVALPVIGVVVALVLAGPWLMAGSDGVTSNVEQRETAVGNGSARLAYNEVSAELLARHPLTGTGFDSFAGASAPLMPDGLRTTAHAHDGFAQAFVDGGLPLGLAVLAAAAAPFAVAIRRRVRNDRPVPFGSAPVGAVRAPGAALGAVLGLTTLALHTAVDIDWTYPALLGMYGVLAALVVGPGRPTRPAGQSGRRPRRGVMVAATAGVALAVLVPLSVRGTVADSPRIEVPAWARIASFGLPVVDPPTWARGAGECVSLMSGALAADNRAALSDGLDCTEAAGQDAPAVAVVRARALVRLGRAEEGFALAEATAHAHGRRIPQLVVAAAALPADAGDRAEAARQVELAARDPRVVASADATAFATAVLTQLGRG